MSRYLLHFKVRNGKKSSLCSAIKRKIKSVRSRDGCPYLTGWAKAQLQTIFFIVRLFMPTYLNIEKVETKRIESEIVLKNV